MEVGIDTELLEKLDVCEGFKDAAVQFVSQIELSFRAIVEFEPEYKVMNVSCVDYPKGHQSTPTATFLLSYRYRRPWGRGKLSIEPGP